MSVLIFVLEIRWFIHFYEEKEIFLKTTSGLAKEEMCLFNNALNTFQRKIPTTSWTTLSN